MGEVFQAHVGDLGIYIQEDGSCDGCLDGKLVPVIVLYGGSETNLALCRVHAREAMEQLRFFIQGGVQGD